jgi:flavin reductase (DIM6/NTAB) family NADH-FMN oxidoreductase RutF
MSEQADISPGAFWQVLGQRAVGMTLVTAADGQGPVGFIGLSAAHVSASPPTLLVSLDHKTAARAVILERRHFAINYLGRDQRALADLFADRGSDRAARFASPDWTRLATGAPVLSTALGAFDCEVVDVIERAGTSVVFGKVAAWHSLEVGEPLVYFRGKYLP